MKINNHDVENTRANLAYLWSLISGVILGYIVVRWGDKMEILTLIIGLVGGTVLGGIFGFFFGNSISKKSDPNPTINTDKAEVNIHQKEE